MVYDESEWPDFARQGPFAGLLDLLEEAAGLGYWIALGVALIAAVAVLV